jgi:predicted nuclease of predicted toxin-antitoxin system
VKLLLDQNLSFKLIKALADVFPEMAHVRDVGLDNSDDTIVWAFARQNGYTILSKDSDFRQLSFVHGAPPKVIWLDLGNCSTAYIEQIVSHYAAQIFAFDQNPAASFLVLQPPAAP